MTGSDDVSSRARSPAVLGALCGAAAALCWAAGFVAARHGVAIGMTPPDIAFHRFVWAGFVLIVPVARAGLADLGGVGWGRGLALTLFAGPPQSLLAYFGFTLVPLGHGAVIQPASAALAGLLLAWLVLKEHLSLTRLFGAIIIVAGLVVFGIEAVTTMGRHGVGGDLLFLGAGISWAVFGTLLRRWRTGGPHAAAVVVVLSMLIYLPLHAFLFGFAPMRAIGLAENLLQILVQGVFAGVVAIYLFARSVALLGAGRAGVFPALVPGFALVIGFVVLGEVPTPLQLAGLIIVAIGLRFALKP